MTKKVDLRKTQVSDKGFVLVKKSENSITDKTLKRVRQFSSHADEVQPEMDLETQI